MILCGSTEMSVQFHLMFDGHQEESTSSAQSLIADEISNKTRRAHFEISRFSFLFYFFSARPASSATVRSPGKNDAPAFLLKPSVRHTHKLKLWSLSTSQAVDGEQLIFPISSSISVTRTRRSRDSTHLLALKLQASFLRFRD